MQSRFDMKVPVEFSIEQEGDNYDDIGIDFFNLL